MKKIFRQVFPGSVGSKSFLGVADNLNRWDVLLFLVIAGIFFSADTGLNLFGFPLTTQKVAMGTAFIFLSKRFFKEQKNLRIRGSKLFLLVLLGLFALVSLLASFINSDYQLSTA